MNRFWLGLCIGIVIGATCLLCGVLVASAASAGTTVTVVINDEVSSANVTAAVGCNEVNCSATSTTTQEEVGWFGRIINWFKNLL